MAYIVQSTDNPVTEPFLDHIDYLLVPADQFFTHGHILA